MKQKKYSIYVLFNPITKKPFYVGITTNPPQRLADHIIKYKKVLGCIVEMRIIKDNLCEKDALFMERVLIVKIGNRKGVKLLNKVKIAPFMKVKKPIKEWKKYFKKGQKQNY